MRRSALPIALSALVVGGATLALPAQAATAPPSLHVQVLDGARTAITGDAQLNAWGTTDVDFDVARADGGTAVRVDGPSDTLPAAVQFPAYDETHPRAAVLMTPTSGEGLDPGAADFEFGAVFRLDEVSEGDSGDNGNNVFQRGISSDDSMFKVEVDTGRPGCKVKGSDGQVNVRSNVVLPGGDTWYKMVCTREGNRLTTSIKVYRSSDDFTSTSGYGASGTLSFADGRAATLGAKTNAAGTILSSGSDPFNGAVALAWTRQLP